MTTSTDTDRASNGRFVRNLALSLSGGAVLTLLGASAAHADDLSDAGTVSDGTGKAHSGDATAVGNQSSTNNTQTVTVSGNLGTIQIINQQANVSNTGQGVANTGGNIAIGNSSNNGANGTQTGNSGLGPASNTGTAGNSSNGSASISTGNASSIGNQSNTTLNQTAHGSAHGVLGGILIINQDATVTNSGVALANTGDNEATGNESDNTAGLIQDANNAAGIAANSGRATNASDGKGYINTGNASATGNKSDTSITQSATGSAGGALGGLVIIDQNAFVVNEGSAEANTGGNVASGNSSTNTANAGQDINTGGDPDPIGVASNNGEASNWSDGTAGITTGDASALGNDSKTTIHQNADVSIEGSGGGSLVTQGTNVINRGIAVANSGDNTATGNDSTNTAGITQDVPSSGADFIGVTGNFGLAQNTSDGTGTIHSGKASAGGNKSETTVHQSSDAKGGAFNLHTQNNEVENSGSGTANSGDNTSTGNLSESTSDVDQVNNLPVAGSATDVGANFGMADNTSDGSASITTGNAAASGNVSTTHLSQTIDPTGLVVPVQEATVSNSGEATANSGGNDATGNQSNNTATTTQATSVGVNDTDPTIVAGTLIGNNDGQASNASDGSASIHTGNASATGNESATDLAQDSNGTIDGMGLILNTQVAGVVNVGMADANSGDNTAIGNESTNEAVLDQDAEVGSDNAADTTITAGVLAASNNGVASNASDGSASIHTGNANATGNRSATQLSQDADGDISGLGGVINTQAAGVINGGVGIANSGDNEATGNASDNSVDADQDVEVGSGNADDVTITAGVLTATNDGEATNASDGSADITTGQADATGNASSTKVDQVNDGDVSGLGMVLNTQVAGVANLGLGVANSGGNTAFGNVSVSDADLDQRAEVGSDNDGTVDILAGSVSAANAGRASNTSDGGAKIHTGGAQAQGNVSTTNVTQDPHSSVDGLGMVIGTQVAGVLNAGAGVANSGLNEATGNASGSGQRRPNDADLDQDADIGSDAGTVDLTALSVTAHNAGEASNTSDGSAKVKTGGALATGNASATNVTQNMSGNVSEMGLVIGTQAAGVANVGAGVANSGLNEAVGNASTNVASNTQNADIVPDPATPVIVFGPAVASNSGHATNDSDGEACVCTGNAVASGNVSSTTVLQDLDLSTGSGLVVVTQAGGVLNAGLGVANSGLNEATGNASSNTATTTQDALIDDAIDGLPLLPPQIANNGGGASNSSNGKALVASGNASGTGNQSTTNFAQVAAVDSDMAVSTLTGGTVNAGVGLANSGMNVGIGNQSVNEAVLDQDADGAGIVSNQGEATNDSDGTATIGDPSKCDDEVTTPPTTPTPGKTGLPVTGGPLEVEAAIALMLLLVGFGLRRKGQSLA